VRQKILAPFETLTDVPYELSKGNLTVPIQESKSRFFGRFVWGVDLLRENMEQQKQRELALQKDKKTLLLSLSHDIKTPLSAIKLYAKALSKGLYPDAERQVEIADSINDKADEIERYVTQIIRASNEDFLSLKVTMGEFYLSELVDKITVYYRDKLELVKTNFHVDSYGNCLLKGDSERCIEVLQNIVENAIKYGDGSRISLHFSEEDGCVLICVRNTGCTLPDTELPHIFDSFWRGSNAEKHSGSGLGLYICRQLMHKMGGEIFAQIKDDCMMVTAVFPKA
jgi:signal transduction histidine kinase